MSRTTNRSSGVESERTNRHEEIHPFLLRLWLLLAAVALVAAACGDDGGESRSGDSSGLPGTTWHLTNLDGAPAATEAIASLEFGVAGGVSGSSGCNSFNGSYETDGDNISFGPLASTKMLCPPPLDEQEQAFLLALDSAATYGIADDVLTLSDADGESVAEFDRFDPSLPGSSWTALSYNNGNEGVVSVINGTEITADFGEDGTVSGSAGCNSYSGTYAVDGNSISIGQLAATETSCLDPDGVMEQEQQYLTALQTAATWSIDGSTLGLHTADDAIAATFAPG